MNVEAANVSWTETDERKKKQRTTASDAVMAERHRGFDLSAQDNHAKSERAYFSVVGEGSQSANANYQKGYALIDWSN